MFRLVTVAAEDVAASKATALAESTARMFATLSRCSVKHQSREEDDK
jgi:hypothetical protein